MNRVQKFANSLPKEAILTNSETANVKGGLRFFISKTHPLVQWVVAIYRQYGANVHERAHDWCVDW